MTSSSITFTFGADWENFIESGAHVLSHLLTDEEKEYIIKRFQDWQSRLQRFSSENLLRLAAKSEDEGKTPFCRHKGTCIYNSLRGFLKSFGVSFAVKYGVATIPSVLWGKVFRNPRLLLKHLFSMDTFRFALFLGTFIGSFKGILCWLRWKRAVEDGWNSFVAGTLAGASILLDFSHRRTAIALVFAIRNLQAAVNFLVSKRYLPTIPNFDAILMGLASSQIIYAYIMAQDTIPRQYLDFLIVQGGIRNRFPGYERQALQLIGDFVKGGNDNPILNPSEYSMLPFFPANRINQNQPEICQMLHPHTEKCSRYHLEYFLECLPRGLRLYLPLNLLTGIVFRFKSFRKDPGSFILHWLKSSSRSTVFLSTFCTLCYLVTCHGRNLLGREVGLMYHLNGFIAGLSIMLESKPKRIEFAMYCLPRAIESLWRLMLDKGYVKAIRHGEVFYFALAMGILTYLYQNEPDSIQESYRSFLTRFLGRN